MMDILNVMEKMVEHHMDECISDLGACNCKRCRQDIKALALNMLPPSYATQPQPTTMVFYKLGTAQDKTNIHTALTKAIRIVMENPRHDEPE